MFKLFCVWFFFESLTPALLIMYIQVEFLEYIIILCLLLEDLPAVFCSSYATLHSHQ